MIFRELSNAAFRFCLRRPGAEIMGGGVQTPPPPSRRWKIQRPSRARVTIEVSDSRINTTVDSATSQYMALQYHTIVPNYHTSLISLSSNICSVLGLFLGQGVEWKIQTESQHKEWKIWLKNIWFQRTKKCYGIKMLKIEHKWHQNTINISYRSLVIYMSNSKMKIERMSPKFWLTTSHHQGEWNPILQFAEYLIKREWNFVDAR